jgi:hypothetical protein
MEVPMASAKTSAIAVMKVFMTGLPWWREWLSNNVTLGALAEIEREAIHLFAFCFPQSRNGGLAFGMAT